MDPKELCSTDLIDGTVGAHIKRPCNSRPTVIVIGAGISGIAAARSLYYASFKVIVLESRDRIGGRIYTDYSFGCPVDMGASWFLALLHQILRYAEIEKYTFLLLPIFNPSVIWFGPDKYPSSMKQCVQFAESVNCNLADFFLVIPLHCIRDLKLLSINVDLKFPIK
ncbi:hypothetical protein V8G54_037616 [Vigna mungo]|uniref:Amine oxidase domain-containing protein n=1 Tax=Vigna mungo TaxID=3915 RepID=A0AAQ3MJ79_VIGMU